MRRALLWGAALLLPALAWGLWVNARLGLVLSIPGGGGTQSAPLPPPLAVIAAVFLALGFGTWAALWQARRGSLRSMFRPGLGRFLLCAGLALATPATSVAIFPIPTLFALAAPSGGLIEPLIFLIYTSAWLLAAGLIIAAPRPKWLRVLLFGQAWLTLWAANTLLCGVIPFVV